MANEIEKINTNFQPGANTETMTPDVTPTVQTKEPWAIQVKRPDETVYKLGIAPETKKQSFVEYVSSDPKTRQSLSEFISVNNQKAINGAVPLDKLPGGSDLYKNSTGWTTSLYTPERLAQIKSMPKIGMAEAFGMLNKWEMFPYINGVALAEDVKVFNIMKRLKENPDNVTAQDKDYAYKFLDEMAQMELRGLSFGGNMIYYGLRMPAYAIEFAGAVSAIGGLGTAAREATELTVKQGLKATVKEVAKGAVKAGGKGLLATVTPVAKFGGLTVPNVAMLARPAKNYYQRRLNDSISITDKGEVLYKEATEKPAMTMLKSFGDTWIENSSEMAGAFLFKPITGAVGRNLPKGFGTGFKALVEKTTGFKYAKAIAKFGGYDGMLEELGEERVGDFLRTALNLENKGYSFDAFGQALFPDWDQLQVELGLISIYGGASYAMGNLATKLSKDKSPQEVEQIMKQVSSLSQKESEKMVNQLNNIETEKDVQEYNQKIQDFKDMVGENVPRETLDANIAIWDNMINVLANKTGKTRSELADELPIVKSMKQGELQGLFQGEAPMFYSNLQKTLSEKMPEKATAEQVRGIIKDIKQEEKDWSGIEDYLKDNPKASKQDLLNYLKANEVKLEEITKGKIVDVMSPEFGADSPYKKSLHEKYNALTTTKLRELATQEELAKMDEEIRLSEKNKTKFEQWQLSGGENYREVLMTLPTAGGVVKPKIEKIEQMSPQTKDGVTRTGYAVTLDTGLVLNFRNAVSDRDAVTSAHAQIESGLVPIKGEGFKSSHWEEKNVLAHFRLNDRIDSDGKKVLFIEEIQSDWHQEGRKKGYVIENAESYEPNIRKVPNAPFKKTWHELAFKRIVREGVEKGYDKIGWTTGQQQADRYDLSKQLNSIRYDPINTNLKAYDKNDNLVINKGVTKDELEDNIGKDATRKLFEKENTHINKFGNAYLHTLEGIDLKVGGEGMKGFYDKILVDYANKFGKKFGTKVEDIEIKRQDGQFKLSKEGKQIDSDIVHGLEITPQMKESVMAGQSLFQGAKGAFNAKNNIIALFETADRSTFLHESAHAFFEMYLKHLPTELNPVLKWAGFEGKKIEDLTDKQYVKLQESFASGFELYLREGKAPSMKLADAFESFKEWLTNIYETVQSLIETAGLRIKLSDDIKNFYDEMLAVPADRVAKIDERTPEEIERDLVLFQNEKKKEAERLFKEMPISEVFTGKIRLTEESKGLMDRYDVPSNLRTKSETAKTLDEWADTLGMSEEQVLEEVAKIGSKTKFINDYVEKAKEQAKYEAGFKETEKTYAQKLEERAPIEDATYEQNFKIANKSQSFIEDIQSSSGDIYKMTGAWLNKILVPLSSRAEKISPKLKQALRKFEFDLLQKNQAKNKEIVPFLEKYSKLSERDASDLDFALKISDMAKVTDIVNRNGMEAEYKRVVDTLDRIYQEAQEVGMDVGFLINYFPRRVEKVEELKSYLRNTNEWSAIEEEIKKKDPNNEMTEEEKMEFVGTMLRGMGNGRILLSRPDNAKERKIITLTPEMNQYYKDSSQALIDYIRSMTEVIEAKRFFGKSEKDIDESIGSVILDMVKRGEIDYKDEAEAKQILKARFNQKGTHGIWAMYRNFNYITLLGSPISAVTQIEDIGVTMYKSGVFNAAKSLVQSITGQAEITVEDLGLESVTQEFMAETGSSEILKKLFKATGFSFMDKLGKQSFVNGVLNKYKDLAKSNNKDFIESLDNIFGEEAPQVLNDLKTGVISDNVKYLMFNELAEVQPLSLSEMPEAYVTGGNSRVYYALKTFTVRRLDFMRRTIINEISQNKVQGMMNLGRLMFFLMLSGASADYIKDFLLGRDPEPEEYLVNNIFKMFGIGKWVMYQARREGLMSALSRMIWPPFKLMDDLYKDVVNMRELPEWDTWSNLPVFGKFYYWWFGRGSQK